MKKLPDGLKFHQDWSSDTRLIYEYHDSAAGSGAQFDVRANGRIEVASYGAPAIPAEVFTLLAAEADRLKRRGE